MESFNTSCDRFDAMWIVQIPGLNPLVNYGPLDNNRFIYPSGLFNSIKKVVFFPSYFNPQLIWHQLRITGGTVKIRLSDEILKKM
jgi:hypothetical protein